MKKARSLLILVVILVIAVVVLFFVNKSFKKDKTSNTFIDETTGEEITVAVDDSEDANAEDISVFMVEDDDITGFTIYGLLNEKYTFVLDEDKETWKYKDDESIDINEDVIKECLGYFSNMTTSTIINGHDKSEYGIDDDSKYILIEAGGNETKISFGDNNSMTGEIYYVINEDYDNIYATSSAVANLLSLNLDYYKASDNSAQ